MSDGKEETYVIASKDIFIDIVNNESEKDQIFNPVSCFMTDRNSTEQNFMSGYISLYSIF